MAPKKPTIATFRRYLTPFKHITFQSPHESYQARLSLYKSVSSILDLFLAYTKIEPHAFLHVGNISKLISKQNLTGSHAISIGLDALKDIILVKNNELVLDVYDIDSNAIQEANNMCERFEEDLNLKFFDENILANPDFENDKYKLAILSQMDYLFDDKTIKELIHTFKQKNIENLIILTPSAYEFSKDPIKLVEASRNIISSMKDKLKDHGGTYKTYRRNIRHFESLFQDGYELIERSEYSYPSGRCFLLFLKLKLN